MTRVTISLTREAYDFLRTLKTKEKSFSDIILDFKQKQDIMRFFGILKERDWDSKEKIIENFRQSFIERLD